VSGAATQLRRKHSGGLKKKDKGGKYNRFRNLFSQFMSLLSVKISVADAMLNFNEEMTDPQYLEPEVRPSEML